MASIVKITDEVNNDSSDIAASAKAVKTVNDNFSRYLSLGGGKFNNGTNYNISDTNTQIVAGDGGGYCTFFKSNDPSQPGTTEIVARNESNAAVHSLKATRDGCLADGVHIVRSINGIKAGADGNVSINIGGGITFSDAVYTSVNEAGLDYPVIYTPNYGSRWGVFGNATPRGGSIITVKSGIYGPNAQIYKSSKHGNGWSIGNVVCLLLA